MTGCVLPRRRRVPPQGRARSPLRVALIASARYAIRQPFAGGLEAHTWALARGLRRRGHEVTIFAGAGCDPDLAARQITPTRARLSTAARADVSMAPDDWLQDHHAYLQLMLRARRARCSLRHRPQQLSALPAAGHRASARAPDGQHPAHASDTLAGVSDPNRDLPGALRRRQSPHGPRLAAPDPLRARSSRTEWTPNQWRYGAGGGPAVWFGRLVPEKGADLAIRAAQRAGIDLELMGPIGDRAYFEQEVAPMLNAGTRYLGHLDHAELAERVAQASVCLVTPRWDEPYGLVAAEALACGTPVCGFDRGALSEVLGDDVAVLVPAGRRARPGRGHTRRQQTIPRGGSRTSSAALLRGRDGRLLCPPLPRPGLGGMIGYYVHHVGQGHLRQALAVTAASSQPFTLLSSLQRPAGYDGPWVQLPRDDTNDAPTDPTAFGQLHWAPIGDAGLRDRMAMIAEWIRTARPARDGCRRVRRGHRPRTTDGRPRRRRGPSRQPR